MSEDSTSLNGHKLINLPNLKAIPRGKWISLVAALLELPAGKAMAVPLMSDSQRQSLSSAFSYRKSLGKKLHSRTVGQETYVWLEDVRTPRG